MSAAGNRHMAKVAKVRKAVPREPTEEMLAAVSRYFETPRIKAEIWTAMFDAAPVLATAPAEPPERARLNQLASLLDHEASQHVPGEKAAWLYEAANRLREK